MGTTSSKSSRVTNVQVPGAQPPAGQQDGDQSTGTTSTDTGVTAGQQASATGTQSASPSEGKPETGDQANTGSAGTGAGAVYDIDALRAQIRAEEQARARAELASQIHAASTVIGGDAPAPATVPLTKGDYKNMRADQVDPTTLTAPVMTRDGWVCPVPPEKK